jgi:hypothetical protein
MLPLAAVTEYESPGQHSQVAYRPDSMYLAHERANPDICRSNGNGEAPQRRQRGRAIPAGSQVRGAGNPGQECREENRAAVSCAQAGTEDVAGGRTTMDRMAGTRTRHSGDPGSREAWARSGAWPPRAQTGKVRLLSALH